jgi:hypothetical protein
MEQTLKQLEHKLLVAKVAKVLLGLQHEYAMHVLDNVNPDTNPDKTAEHIVNFLREHLVKD